jgi:hypothetical protein
MTISRLFSLLPLLSLALMGTAAIPLVNNHAKLNPSDLCPLIDILDHELCSDASSPVQSLCILLQKYNASFCSSHGHKPDHDAPHVAMSNDALSVRVLHNEYYANTNKSSVHQVHPVHPVHPVNQTNAIIAKDIHKVCPIIIFIEQELCSPAVKFEFDPKELCPLLNLTYTEFCAGIAK